MDCSYSYRLSLYGRGADHIVNTASSIVAKACLLRRRLAIEVLLLRARVLWKCVYQAVA
jgi:hypothetical protein